MPFDSLPTKEESLVHAAALLTALRRDSDRDEIERSRQLVRTALRWYWHPLHRWGSGHYMTKRGWIKRACMLGAMGFSSEGAAPLMLKLAFAHAVERRGIIAYNDKVARSVSDIRSALRMTDAHLAKMAEQAAYR